MKKKAPEPAATQAPSITTGAPAPTGGLSVISSMGTMPQNFGAASSVGGGAHSGPPVFLRICVPEDTDAVLRYTTINVFVFLISHRYEEC